MATSDQSIGLLFTEDQLRSDEDNYRGIRNQEALIVLMLNTVDRQRRSYVQWLFELAKFTRTQSETHQTFRIQLYHVNRIEFDCILCNKNLC